MAWLSYWDPVTRAAWINQFGVEDMNPQQFRQWLISLSTTEEFGEDGKVANLVLMAMWAYEEKMKTINI
jgi:hypothetical protein